MISKEKQGYITEIKYQKDMLTRLNKWLRNSLICSSIGFLLILFFPASLIVTIIGYIITVLCIICGILIGLAIYRGRKNVIRIIDKMELKVNYTK